MGCNNKKIVVLMSYLGGVIRVPNRNDVLGSKQVVVWMNRRWDMSVLSPNPLLHDHHHFKVTNLS